MTLEQIPGETLSVPQAARIIGIGENQLYEALKQDAAHPYGERRLPFVIRFGRSIRISKRALAAWLESPRLD
jgi:excisionase family DNA binding protein